MNDQDVRDFLDRMATEEPVPFADAAPLIRRARHRAARTIAVAAVGLVAALALVFAGASVLPEDSTSEVPLTVPSPPPAAARHGYSTFTSSIHGITIGYPSGWKVRSATESWNEGPVTFTAPGVDVIFDPSLRGDVYLALASEPLGDNGRSDWPMDPPSSTRICAHATGMDWGAITVDGASGYIDSCGSPTSGGYVLMVATDARGYVIYLHVADDRALQRTYDGDFFDTLVETIAFGSEPTAASPDPSPIP